MLLQQLSSAPSRTSLARKILVGRRQSIPHHPAANHVRSESEWAEEVGSTWIDAPPVVGIQLALLHPSPWLLQTSTSRTWSISRGALASFPWTSPHQRRHRPLTLIRHVRMASGLRPYAVSTSVGGLTSLILLQTTKTGTCWMTSRPGTRFIVFYVRYQRLYMFMCRYLFTRANSFTDTDLAKLSIDETHLQKANNYAMQAQTPALRAITNARNEQQARMLEQRARAQAQQAQARAAAAAAAAAGEQPSSTNATASSPRPPSGFPQSSPAPSSSTPAPQPPTPNSNGAQLASSAPPQSPVPVANGLQANGSQTPQTPHTPLQQYTQMQQAALLQQAKQRNGLQTVPRPSQQPNGIARPPLTPQQQAALTQQQVERMQQANMTHAHAQQAQLMANGGSGQNMLAAEAAMRQAHAAAAAAARSSPSMSHQQPADPNGLTNGQARPTPSQQGQMALPQVNGFPQMPFGVYHAQLAQQPAQANGMQNGAGTNGQMNGGPMSYYAANGNPQQPQQYLQVLQMAAQMKNGANGPQITNGIPNAMLAQFPQGQNGVSRPGIMPPPQQQQQQPAQPGMWVAPGMPTPNSASAALQSMGISPTTNMSLKMPPTRQMAWSRQNSDTGAGLNGSQPPQQNGMMGPPTGSPVQQHMSSPTLAGRSSPVRLVNGGQQGRNSPMNMHPGSSPVMDQHGTPQPHRQTSNPSPLGLPQDMSMLPHQSPHLAMRSPAHQHQVIGSSPG